MAFHPQVFSKASLTEEGELPLPFPILMDDGAAISKGMDLFSTEWGGSKVEQNVPTV